MAAGNWIMYDAAKELVGGGINFPLDSLKMMLTDDGHTPNRSSHALVSDISGDEIANGDGYTTGGAALTSVSYDQTSGTAELDCDPVEWTASGSGLANIQYAHIYWDDQVSSPPAQRLIAYCQVESTPVDVAATQKFRVTPHANGVLRLSGMTS